ncbi:MAG: hypothetical protein H6558_15365 [Lewinellaceae bacterium]|nr:hypothetical protein [Lewinellaceae bacterium]MCB9291175.1 hypothetical protein [Lewinellaceae bacterium]
MDEVIKNPVSPDEEEKFKINDFRLNFKASGSLLDKIMEAMPGLPAGGQARIFCQGAQHLKDFVFPVIGRILAQHPQNTVFLAISYKEEAGPEEAARLIARQLEKITGEETSSEDYFHYFRGTQLKEGQIGDRIEVSFVEASSLDRHEFPAERTETGKEEQKYDVIFSCFALHFALNWRIQLLNLLNQLKPEGLFCFSEAKGDFMFLDGNFSHKEDFLHPRGEEHTSQEPQREAFIDFLLKFESERIEKGFYWQPEIRMADYGVLKNHIMPLFEGIEKYDSPLLEHKTTLRDIITLWLKKQLISYFKIGVQPDDPKADEYLENFNKKTLDNPLHLKKGFSFFLARKFRGLRLLEEGRIPNLRWAFDNHLNKIRKINDNKYETLGKKAIDILASHDLFVPRATYYCAIIGWNENLEERDYPIHLAVNGSQGIDKHIIKSKINAFGRYISNKGLDFTIDEFIFRNIKQKFPVTIRILSAHTPPSPEFYSINISGLTKDKTKAYIFARFDFGDKGEINKLEILLPPLYDLGQEEHQKALKVAVTWDKTKNFFEGIHLNRYDNDYRGINQFFIAGRNFTRLSINQANADLLSGEYGIQALFDSSYFAYEEVYEKEGKLFFGLLGFEKEEQEHKMQVRQLIITLYCIATFLLEGNTDEQVTFFPSGLIKVKDSDQIKGLGGIILHEKWEPGLSPAIRGLIKKRDEGLAQTSNLLFSKANIANYVDKDYIGKALKAAIAAIIARNGSHGLGSHVLPTVSHSAQNPFDNQLLFTYLEQRLDFIAQVATEFPSWTFPTWFNNDLMMRFYMQRHILRNLAKAEKLDAYEFNVEGKKEELLWSELNQWKKAEKNNSSSRERRILHGFILDGASGPGQKKRIYHLVEKHPETFKGDEGNTNNRVRCLFKEPLSIKNNTQARIIGTLYLEEPEGLPELKNAKLIEQKLVIKVRKRSYYKFEDNNKLDDNGGRCYPFSNLLYRKNLFDAGKTKSIANVLNAKPEEVYVYGVLYENLIGKREITELKILSSSIFNPGDDSSCFIPCKLARPVVEQDIIRKLKLGRRLIVRGKAKGAINNGLTLEDAWLEEAVKINYIVGERHRAESLDKLEQDMLIAIPGGVVGYQGFYTILENVIRNAAKHDWMALPDWEKRGRNLEVKIELEERQNKDYIICRVWTNAMNLRLAGAVETFTYGQVLEADEKMDKKEGQPLLHLLNQFLEAPIIDEKGEWKKENLGLVETKIAAGYLSNQPIRTIGYPGSKKPTLLGSFWNGDPGFVKSSAIWEAEGNELIPRLGYKLKLNKPKEVFLLGRSERLEEYRKKFDSEAEKLHTEGILFQAFEKHCKEKRVVDYDFCVIILRGAENIPPGSQPAIIRNFLEVERLLRQGKSTKRDQALGLATDRLIEEIEYYPYRFFIVTNKKKQLSFFDNQYQSSKEPVIKFVRSRLIFLSEEEFDSLFKSEDQRFSKGQVFKLKLFDQWLSYYRFQFHKDRKLSDEQKEAGLSDDTVYHSIFFDLGIDEGRFRENLSRDKSVIAGAFNTFKSFIIEEFLQSLYEAEPETAAEINQEDFEAFLFEQEPESQPFSGQQIFLQNWLSTPFGQDFRRHLSRLMGVFEHYRDIYAKLYQKAGGEIETLPHVFRPGRVLPRENSEAPEIHYLQSNRWQEKLLKGLQRYYRPYVQDDETQGYYHPAYHPIGYIRHGSLGKSPYCYLDYLSGGQIFYSILKKYPSDEYAFNKLLLQLVENPLAKLMIIDERVQAYVEEFDYWSRLSNVNIIIPFSLTVHREGKKPQILLGKEAGPNVGKTGRKSIRIAMEARKIEIEIQFSNPLNTPVRTEGEQYRNLINSSVIHHSILEEIFAEEKSSIETYRACINQFIKEIKLNHIPSVIVTSGKGEPKDLSRYAKFLPFSNIESFLLQPRPEKFLLTQILMKTLRRRN